MRAQVIRRYGDADALVPADLPRPAPGEGELLVKVHAAGVNPVDWRVRRGDLWFLSGRDFPKVLGSDIAGTVTAMGPGARGFAEGDEVYAVLPVLRGGAYAEYAVAKTSEVARKPSALSFQEAAAVPLAALTALQALRDEGGLQRGT